MSCDGLRKTLQTCDSDFDCVHGYICWYNLNSDFINGRKKYCIKKWSYDIGTKFGWAPMYYDNLKDIYHHG